MKKWLYAVTALATMCAPASAQVVSTKTGLTYTFVNSDCDPNGRRLVLFDNAAGVAVSLPQAGANGQFISGCIIKAQNIGTGDVVITPTTSAINEATTYTLTAGASVFIVADAGPSTTGNYWVATGSVPSGSGGRTALDTMPPYFTMSDFSANPRPAKRRPAHVTVADASPNVQVETTYSITASRLVCTNGSTTVTMTPGVFPNSANQAGTKRIKLPGCGVAGAALQADVTSITSEGTTQTIVIGVAASTNVDTGAQVVIGPQGLFPVSASTPSSQERLTYNVAIYAPVTFAAGGTTVTLPANTFAAYDYTTPGFPQGYRADIAIPNATGTNCADTLVTKITALDGTNAIATVADAPRCALTGVSRWVYWGQSIFGPSNVGDSVELIDGASSGTAPLVATISSVTDPSHFVMGTNNAGVKTRANTQLTWGPNTTSQFTAMTAAAVAAGYQYLYVPVNDAYFLATGTTVSLTANGARMTWCGDGDIYLPSSIKLARAVSRACNGGVAPPLAESTIVPSLHLRTASNTGSTLKVAFVGDSQLTPNYTLGRVSIPDYFCDGFRQQNPAKTVTCDNFSLGSQTWGSFDPNGPSYGNGAGIPAGSTASFPAWYTPTTNKWYTFVQAACPDIVVFKLGVVDGQNFLWSAFTASIATTQNSTWRAACGKTPDILIATEGAQGMGTPALQQNSQRVDYVMPFLRGWTLSCEYRLANGGCPGLLDIGRARSFANLGWHDEFLPPTRAPYIVANSSSNQGQRHTDNVYTWPIQTYDYQILMSTFRSVATTPTEWWADVQSVDFSIGNGEFGTPENGGLQTGLVTTYGGGRVRLGFDTGTTNYTIQVRSFDVDTSATVSVATTTVTCAAACTNMGFVNASIQIPGAGIAGGTYTGTVTAINSAGTSITITPAVDTALVSQAVTLKFYHDQLATFDTGVPARCTNAATICDSAFQFALKGTMVTLYDGTCFGCAPIWSGRVARFGGYHRPTVTIAGTFSSFLTTTDSSDQPNQLYGSPELGTFYKVLGADNLAFGLDNIVGQWGGGGHGHASTLGDQWVVPVVIKEQNLNATVAPTSSAVNTPTNGFSYTVPDQQLFTAFTPAGTLATGTVTLPGNVPQGSRVQVMSTQAITTLTVAVPAGYSLAGATASTLAANATAAWILNGTVFYRVQ